MQGNNKNNTFLLLVDSLHIYFNPYKPTLFFVGYGQTVQHQISRRMIGFCTVCLQNVLLKFEKKMINTTQQPLKQKWTGPIDNSRKFHSA